MAERGDERMARKPKTHMRWLSIGLLVAIIGPACKRQEAGDDRAPNPPTQAVSPAPTNADSGDSGWDSPEAVRLSGVQYTPPIQSFGVLSVTSPDGYFDSIGPGYKIGTFVDGRYRGADMVSAQLRTDEPCKGDGCEVPEYLRFVKVGDQLVFLRKNSEGGSHLWTGAFSAAGLSLVSDSQFAVQAFLSPHTIVHGSETFRLVSRLCGGHSLRVAFRHPVFQQVRSDGQLFYVTRPDGSCLAFEYVPYFSEKEIVWDSPPKEPNSSGYSWKKDAQYGHLEMRYDPFVAADVVQIDRDATVVGHTQRGGPVYELKDSNQPLLKEFYRDCEADLPLARPVRTSDALYQQRLPPGLRGRARHLSLSDHGAAGARRSQTAVRHRGLRSAQPRRLGRVGAAVRGVDRC